MKVLLVNSGNDAGIEGNANSQSYPPLGIISLGTSLKNRFEDRIDVMLMDGQLDSVENIVNQIRKSRPNLVGVSMYCTSIHNSLRIIEEAKGIHAITILGNDHAAFHYHTLLSKIPEIDYICTNDIGEITLVMLVSFLLNEISLDKVPALAYRLENQIRHNSDPYPLTGTHCLDALPIPDRLLLDNRYWQYYLSSFRTQYHKTFDPSTCTGVATINRARGCARKQNPCRYCGIANLTPRGSSARIFWEDVRMAKEQVQASHLYEAFDSASSWYPLLNQWLKEKPDDLSDIRFKMYSQAAETNERIVDLFSKLGVFCINSGFDSGDTETLQLLKGKNDSLEKNRHAATLWTEAGIEIYTSFVLVGLGNEYKTRKSLDATLEFAEWLASSTTTVSFDSALLYPDKSSTVGSWLWNTSEAEKQALELGWTFIDFDLLYKVSAKWKNEVFLDPLQLCCDFAQICGIDPHVLFEYEKEIQRLSNRYSLNFGKSQGGPVD